MRKGQRLTGMTSRQASFPIAASKFRFAQHGQSGAWISELLPHTARVADELCFIKSMHTEAINHDPAVTFFQTGAQLAGRPSIGAWLSYGLGSENRDLPAFVAMISQGTGNPTDQPLYDRLWGSGFLAVEISRRQVPLGRRSGAEPVESAGHRRGDAPPNARRPGRAQPVEASMRSAIRKSPRASRNTNWPSACRRSVPELMDLADEPARVFRHVRAGIADARARSPRTACWPGGWASGACGSSQLFHRGWDQHVHLPKQIERQCPRHRPAGRGLGGRSAASAGCSTTRWSCGEASSAARSIARENCRPTITAATTIRAVSPSGWPAPASSRA